MPAKGLFNSLKGIDAFGKVRCIQQLSLWWYADVQARLLRMSRSKHVPARFVCP